jgi:hypothetical protein
LVKTLHPTTTRILSLFLVVIVCVALGDVAEPGIALPIRECDSCENQQASNADVFLVGEMPEDDLIALSATVAAGRPNAVLLFDSPACTAANRSFLKAWGANRVCPVGQFKAGIAELERHFGAKVAKSPQWVNRQPVGLWKVFFPRATRVVVCPAKSRQLLLQAAALAGTIQAPLWVHRSLTEDVYELKGQLADWQAVTVYAVGSARDVCREAGVGQVIDLADECAVSACRLKHLRSHGPVKNLVVANPADSRKGLASMACLAPWVAVQRRAALLLTNFAGDDVGRLVNTASGRPALAHADTLIVMGDLDAIPLERRANPVPGKDAFIEMEPLTPVESDPFTFATGRLFHEDKGVVALMLARARFLTQGDSPRKALVISNPTGGLPLLETFSKNTALELMNRGYQTTAFVGEEADPDELRRLLPAQDVFLWEGHFATMVKEYHLHEWTEPLRPSLVFLQSCLALTESKAHPFLERGALGVLGTSTRTYSGSGGACSLAFFDALLYEKQSVGGALRQAKNFLLAYSQLKEKRLGADARLSGANVRSAWAFSLWGDPTLTLPAPRRPDDALPYVRHHVHGDTITVRMPDGAYEKAINARYKAKMMPNERLAGLLTKEMDDGKQLLIPFVFVEVHLPNAPPGTAPRLRGRIPSSHWVFNWDARRSCGYLLIAPRKKDRDEMRFHVEWRSLLAQRRQG